jgi:eukaryotic-like serine/threonine-protein kinase
MADACLGAVNGTDPNYALAYTGLSLVYCSFANLSFFPPKEVMPKAKAAAEQALKLDKTLAETDALLENVIEQYDWKFEAAENEFKRALDIDPNQPSRTDTMLIS